MAVHDPGISQELAQKIMKLNFFGIEEAARYLQVTPTRNQRHPVIECTERQLYKMRDTHILVADFGLSVLDIRSRVQRELFSLKARSGYDGEEFATQRDTPNWRLVRKLPVKNSPGATWDEQQDLLAEDEETPTARIMVYTIIGHFLHVGERLFEAMYVRCSDKHTDGRRVRVGYFDIEGLGFSGDEDGSRVCDVGLGSVWKKRKDVVLS